MEPLSQRHVQHVFEEMGFNAPIKTRRTIVSPKGVDETRAMQYVRAETHFGGYISKENGRPGPRIRAEFRKWIKDGVLNITPEQHRELHHQSQIRRAYYARLQRELEHFEGPFEWKYGHEEIDG